MTFSGGRRADRERGSKIARDRLGIVEMMVCDLSVKVPACQ